MLTLIKKCFRQLGLIIYYLFKLPSWRFHKILQRNQFSGTAYVLVNGPSLKMALQQYDKGEQQISHHTFMVNLSALDPHFKQIKPMHYCLSDPMFYQDYQPKKDQIRQVYDIFENEVDWDMYVYLCFYYEWEYKKLIEYSRVTNPHVKFVLMNRKTCPDLASPLRNRLYKSGYFMPEDGTIANTAIYLALIEGYQEIRLYGADHNFFLELGVNDNNELCSIDSHFYDQGKPKMKVFKNTCTAEDKAFRVHEFMYILYVMFQSHDLLRHFADFLGARIINCTPGSMIDSYERELNSSERK